MIQTNFGFFKQNMQIFDDILKTLELYLNRPIDYVYDKYSEMKRLIQLNAEETIAYIKQSNDVDINTVESQLEPKLLNKVNLIIEQSQKMIDRVEEFQKNISEFYLHNKAPKDRNLIIKLKELEELYSKKFKNEFFSKFTDIIQQIQSSIDAVEEINKKFDEFYSKSKSSKQGPINELREFSKKCLAYQQTSIEMYDELILSISVSQENINKIKSSIFINGTMELETEKIKKNDELSCYLKETVVVEDEISFSLRNILNRSSFLEIINGKYLFVQEIKSNNNPLSLEQCFDRAFGSISRNYFCTSFKYLTLFNPISNTVEKELKFEDVNNFVKMHTNTIQELILIQYESETDYEKINQYGQIIRKLKTILLNKNFEIIKNANISGRLIGADESNLYFIDNSKVNVYDWSLNEVNGKLQDTLRSITTTLRIGETENSSQIECKYDKIYFKYNKCVSIYNSYGALINLIGSKTDSIVLSSRFNFKFTKDNNLIAVSEKELFYFDLNGNLIKQKQINFGNNFSYNYNYFLLDEKENPKLYYLKSKI